MSTLYWNPAQLTGVQNEDSNYIGKRFAFARKKSKKGIPYLHLFEILREVGLEEYAPQPPNAVDAFRRACQTISRGYIKDEDNPYKYKIDMIMIDESDDPILRNIQLTEIDQDEKATSEGKLVARLEFHRDTERFISYCGYSAGYAYENCPNFVVNKINEARMQYQKEKELISDTQLHTIIQKILYSAGNPVNGISSTWNIPATREYILEKLVSLSEKLNEYENDIFIIDTLPVVKTEDTVSKVKNDAITFAINQFNLILEQSKDRITNANADNKLVSERSFEEVRQEGEKIMSLIEEYESLLGEAFDEVRQAKEVVERKLKDFVSSPEQQSQHKIKKANKRRNIKGKEDLQVLVDIKPTTTRRNIKSLSEKAAVSL